MKIFSFSLVMLASAFLTGGASATITFQTTFTTRAQSDLSLADQAKFTDAMNFWSTVITGYRDGVSRTFRLSVDTFSEGASTQGGFTLGSAGPSSVGYSGAVVGAHTSNSRFILSFGGSAAFNIHPDAGILNPLTIRHEIGHALGIGSLWEDNQLYNDGVSGNHNRTLAVGTPGQYVGAAALAAYKAEFDPTATFIPIELDGGDGTAHGHWNEADDNFSEENQEGVDSHPGDGQAARTVLSGPNAGLSLDDELMTGILSGTGFLSNTTIQSLYDIGYTVIPEPSTALMASLAVLVCLRRRR